MKFLIYLFLLVIYPNIIFSYDKKLPFKLDNIQSIYKLNNGNKIYIEQYERGDRIWEKKYNSNQITKISHVWSFIALAKRCEGIESENIYFASNLEYFLGGGAIIDDPQLRIFSLYNPNPWRDSDLGIAKNMNNTKQWCEFYKNLKQ